MTSYKMKFIDTKPELRGEPNKVYKIKYFLEERSNNPRYFICTGHEYLYVLMYFNIMYTAVTS